MNITLPNQEFIDIFNNKKRFVALVSDEWPDAHIGQILTITGDNDGPVMQRIVTHVHVQEVLVRGDAKMMYLSVKPLTKAERKS